MRGPEPIEHVLVLLARPRAYSVDEDAARPHERYDPAQDLALEPREPADVFGPSPPAELGMPPKCAEPGAGRVDQDGVEPGVERRAPRVADERADRRRAEPSRLGRDPAPTGRAPIERDDEP